MVTQAYLDATHASTVDTTAPASSPAVSTVYSSTLLAPRVQMLLLLDVLTCHAPDTSSPSLTAPPLTLRLVDVLMHVLVHGDASSILSVGISSAPHRAGEEGGSSEADIAPQPGSELEAALSVFGSVLRHFSNARQLVREHPEYLSLVRVLIGLLSHRSAAVVLYALLVLAAVVMGEEVCQQCCRMFVHCPPVLRHNTPFRCQVGSKVFQGSNLHHTLGLVFNVLCTTPNVAVTGLEGVRVDDAAAAPDSAVLDALGLGKLQRAAVHLLQALLAVPGA